MKWVSLHTHTTYSTGDGFGTVEEHVERIYNLGMRTIGITEHGNVSSFVELEKSCRRFGLKPIFGCEIYFGLPETQIKCHMTLLAMNLEGLKNLNRLVSESYINFYYKPTVYWETLRKYNAGIIALSGCAGSQLSCTLLGGKLYGPERMEFTNTDIERGIRVVQKYQKVFGDRFYIEVQRFPGLERICLLNQANAKISADTGALLVATADVHYPYASQSEIQKILHGAHRGRDIDATEDAWEYNIPLTYPETDVEMLKDLIATGLHAEEAYEAIQSTEDIAYRCEHIELPKAPPLKYKDKVE